ncbi:hypothetical protein GGS23DRAFT_239403 [Durotheca rogersii]|uniref:uncharacterized protein n=1 Tax=Durotheca rogersii TaxID=419775 RepID=UPI00221F595A|nr:uncharacterized protein GGS23DRAFT_239403 [Durotheca rogersii]KAI5860205.1 hypothetical protein GGS23DRAFT_239403 [Durotheca rogersii]
MLVRSSIRSSVSLVLLPVRSLITRLGVPSITIRARRHSSRPLHMQNHTSKSSEYNCNVQHKPISTRGLPPTSPYTYRSMNHRLPRFCRRSLTGSPRDPTLLSSLLLASPYETETAEEIG